MPERDRGRGHTGRGRDGYPIATLTAMDVLAAHRSALRQFDDRVQIIRDGQWHNPTPDTEWDVTDLVGHLVYEQLWVPPLLAGKTIAEVGDAFEGDVLGQDPKASWTAAAAAARAAFAEPGALERDVHLSFGDVPAPVYLWQMTVDLVVHAWDLAKASKPRITCPTTWSPPRWNRPSRWRPTSPGPACSHRRSRCPAAPTT